MMNFCIKKGAIVRFAFKCQTEGMVSSGKLIDANDEEIVICPQIFIELPDKDGNYSNTLSKQIIDTTRSLDSNRSFHIDRKLIAGWEYAFIESGVMYSNTIRSTDVPLESLNKINVYGKDGFCKG